ncbi:hypothetical protein [Polaribacter sp.]|uniref:hypothetical protein n=1 Tax=Polaribacter sp. TaxID=1920175 RepID=UPI003EF288A8
MNHYESKQGGVFENNVLAGELRDESGLDGNQMNDFISSIKEAICKIKEDRKACIGNTNNFNTILKDITLPIFNYNPRSR